jgi:hypothetical protein
LATHDSVVADAPEGERAAVATTPPITANTTSRIVESIPTVVRRVRIDCSFLASRDGSLQYLKKTYV